MVNNKDILHMDTQNMVMLPYILYDDYDLS